MGTNISLEFPPRSSGAKRKALANQRRISKAGRGRGGRDGRGRGSRDGRGRGRGGRGSRGGRGGHGGRVLINGVDVSDYTRKFSNGEMSQMSARAAITSSKSAMPTGAGQMVVAAAADTTSPRATTARQIRQ